MRRRISLLAALLALAVLLTACAGTQQASDPDHVTLTVMGKRTDLEKSYMTSIFDLYEKATGNELHIIAYEDSMFEQTAAEQFAQGNVPDVFLHFHNADLSRFDIAGNFYMLSEEPWADDLTSSARAYCQNGEGELLGLPFWESSVSGCYYNKTILDGLGLKPANTQAEFDMLCQALADIDYTPICWPANGCTWMFQFGLDPVFADDPSLLEALNRNELRYADIPAVEDMARWITDAAQKGWFGPGYLDTGWGEISTALSSGEAVMTFIWDTWFYTDFVADGQYTKEDFALMPVFMNTADSGSYEGGNLNMMMVNKNSPRLETALEFLSFCAAPENYNVAFDGISTVSCFKGQTTNIQSHMVTDAQVSIAANERVSTAATKIVGYSADDVARAFESAFRGETNAAGCVQLMDEYRVSEAGSQGAAGFPTPPAGGAGAD